MSFGPGNILVANDARNSGAAIMSSASGAVLQANLLGNASAQSGYALSDGRFAVGVGNSTISGMSIYSTDLSIIATGITPSGYDTSHWHPDSPITSDWSETFYLAWLDNTFANFSKFAPVTSTGTAGSSQTLDIKRLIAMAVSLDRSTLYYGDAPANSAILKWNIGGGISAGTLVAGSASFKWGLDFIVTRDGASLLAIQQPAIGTTPFSIKRYRLSDGVLQATYALPDDSGAGAVPRMALDIANNNSVWAMTFETSSHASFFQIDLSSGTRLTQLTVPVDNTDPTKIPSSCPFWAWSQTITPLETTAIPIRRLRRFPHIATDNKRVFISRMEILAEPGLSDDDLLMIRASKDGGYTWTPERVVSTGALGRYLQRVQTYRWGQARDWVFEVSTSGPVPQSLLAAWADLEAGTN